MRPGRIWLVIGVCLGTACFKELPTVPEEMSTSTSAGSEAMPTSEGGSSSGSGAEVTSAAASGVSITATDGDTMMSTGTAMLPPEGLFACFDESCAAWEPPACEGACGPPDEAGKCLFALLRDRAVGRGDMRACEGSCVRTAFVGRAGGTDEVMRQTAVEVPDGLSDYKELKVCLLREPAFFDACIKGLTGECVDVTQWFESCVDFKDPCAD